MTAEYKKRAKGGWNVGKGAKSQSNRNERQYEKQEISELVEDSETHNVPKKNKPNTTLERKIKRILSEIRYVIKVWKSEEGLREAILISNYRKYINGYLSRWKPNIKLLKSYKDSDLLGNKYKRQIVEILEMIGENNE